MKVIEIRQFQEFRQLDEVEQKEVSCKIYVVASYEDSLSICKEVGATAAYVADTESQAIRELLNMLLDSGLAWKARELKEYRK